MALAAQTNGAGVKVKLSKAIASHKGNLTELTLAPLTAGVLIRLKELPFYVGTKPDGTQSFEVKWDLLAAYVVALSGGVLDAITIEQLEFRDLTACANAIGAMIGEGRSGN